MKTTKEKDSIKEVKELLSRVEKLEEKEKSRKKTNFILQVIISYVCLVGILTIQGIKNNMPVYFFVLVPFIALLFIIVLFGLILNNYFTDMEELLFN